MEAILKTNPAIKEALNFAKEKHKGQRRISGEPYIEHPKRVAKIVKKSKKSHQIEKLIIAALLHDTIEDTDATPEEISKKFGPLVASLVSKLTTNKKEKDKIGKKEYLSQKLTNKKKITNWSLVIKLADRLDNISHLKNTTKKFKEKYLEETNFLIDKLEKKRDLSSTQKKLVREIKKVKS